MVNHSLPLCNSPNSNILALVNCRNWNDPNETTMVIAIIWSADSQMTTEFVSIHWIGCTWLLTTWWMLHQFDSIRLNPIDLFACETNQLDAGSLPKLPGAYRLGSTERAFETELLNENIRPYSSCECFSSQLCSVMALDFKFEIRFACPEPQNDLWVHLKFIG